MPGPAQAHIIVESYSKQGDKIVIAGGGCVTVAEIVEQVKRLKADLDSVVADARRKFSAQQGGQAPG